MRDENKEQIAETREMKKEKQTLYKVKLYSIFLFSLFFFLFFNCSSAPKKPAEIFTDRNMAVNQLNLANHTAGRGYYEDALLILEEARRLALGTDDPSLRIKTSMSRGSICFSLGREDEAFEAWEAASKEGDLSGEPILAALSRIYSIRAKLVLLGNRTDAQNTGAAVEGLKTQLSREMAAVKSDLPATAAGHVTMGLAEKEIGHWAEAESAVKKALAIHEKGLFLEDAAYDWFLIASIRSMAGNYESSLDALRTAIRFDRRAENGFGIASCWQAMGDVLQKAGRNEESRTAWRRAMDIYRALGISNGPINWKTACRLHLHYFNPALHLCN